MTITAETFQLKLTQLLRRGDDIKELDGLYSYLYDSSVPPAPFAPLLVPVAPFFDEGDIAELSQKTGIPVSVYEKPLEVQADWMERWVILLRSVANRDNGAVGRSE